MIGAGYVGLTTGTCLAELGHDVCCCDIDTDRIDSIARGHLPIYEQGLAGLIANNQNRRRLSFSSDVEASVSMADIVIIAVGTPSMDNGSIDLSFVEQAARDIARFVKPGAVVVIKSTVVAGTARRIRAVMEAERGESVAVASNPEFLREGSAISDFMNTDRIIVGVDDKLSAQMLAALYAPLVQKNIPYVQTTTENAELIKYAANAFLALKIGFINEVANLCEATGGDVSAVARGIGLDKRIGPAFLAVGPGFGGSCFPKDTRAFAAIGRRFGATQSLVETLIARNEDRKRHLAERILSALAQRCKGPAAPRVAVLGAAFKANTDDIREAAALTIIPLLVKAGIRVAVHDPQARSTAERHLKDVIWHASAYEAAKDADLVVILTEWEEYATLDLKRMSSLMRGDGIIDYRNIFDGEAVTRCGLHYISLGRPPAAPAARKLRAGKGRGNLSDIAASPA